MIEFFALMKYEMIITAMIILLLFIKIGKGMSNAVVSSLVNVLLVVAIATGFFFNKQGWIFGDMFRMTTLMSLQKNILLLAVLIISLQSQIWLKNHKHVVEFYILMFASVLGMMLMISSGNFLIFYLGLELSAIPMAALCNFDLDKRKSSEAAMKMILSSAFASGILLFGISLLYGAAGTLNFEELNATLQPTHLALFAFIMIFAGFSFKLSIVPFHLWTADVYEGSPVAVTSFFSVVSKGAMSFVFITVLYNVFSGLESTWYNVLFLSAIITIIIGNLFALRQQNLKRFLAFSSIAQVGYILIGVSGSSQIGMAAVVYFVLIYVFSNLGAFGVINLVSSLTGRETIDSFKGMYQNNKLLSWVITISLFSLAGIPPTAGFFGKLFLLTAGAEKGNYTLIIIAAVNMMVSLYYYLRVVRAIFMEKNEDAMPTLNVGISGVIALVICVAGILITGIASGAYDYIYSICGL